MAKILIVDDNFYMRKTISTILEGLGHSVVGEATDGSEVLLKYIDCSPDIVTMDILMASKNGLEALKELK